MKPARSPLALVFRIVGIGLAGIVLLIALALGAAYGISHSRMNKVHSVEVRPIPVPNTPEAISHGKHIAVTRGCAECHGSDFGGNVVVDDPMVGKLHGPNITSGRGGLPPGYSDIDYVRAIRHGVTREGRPMVLMPSAEYTRLSDQDLGALIAYLKTLSSVDRESGPVAPGPVLRVMIALGKVTLSADEIDHTGPRPASVRAEASAEYGRYLVASCVGCHGENLSGGKIPGAPPDWPPASNLTPHAASRVTGWSEQDFFTALRARKRPDGTEINPIMPGAFGHMTDLETTALWLYVKSVPAVATGKR